MMTWKRWSMAAASAAGCVCLTLAVAAQGQETYKARLSPLPADAKTRPDLAGSGTVSAVLSGTKLTINGSFEGLKTAAVKAELHNGVAAGVRGPSIQDLTITKANMGTITGSADLTEAQVANFKKGGLYVQLASEKTPDGTLWGWFLK
jgi:hypothetical protein